MLVWFIFYSVCEEFDGIKKCPSQRNDTTIDGAQQNAYYLTQLSRFFEKTFLYYVCVCVKHLQKLIKFKEKLKRQKIPLKQLRPS